LREKKVILKKKRKKTGVNWKKMTKCKKEEEKRMNCGVFCVWGNNDHH
jgi:hypothetical protein